MSCWTLLYKQNSYKVFQTYFSWDMVNKWIVANYSAVYKSGERKSSFHFPEDPQLKRRWICFVNLHLSLTKNSICIEHLEDRFIKRGRKWNLVWKCNLFWNLHPAPANALLTGFLRKIMSTRTREISRKSCK